MTSEQEGPARDRLSPEAQAIVAALHALPPEVYDEVSRALLSEWVTLPEAGDAIGVTKQTMHRMVSRNLIRAFPLGRKPLYVVREADVLRFGQDPEAMARIASYQSRVRRAGSDGPERNQG